MPSAVMWFRRDLRLGDLPALGLAAGAADAVVPLFVLDPRLYEPAGPNRRHFLACTLTQLDRQLAGNLVVRRGNPAEVVPAVAAEAGARTVAVTADFGPYGARRDRAVAAALGRQGAVLRAAGSPYLVEPGTLRSAGGGRFAVFTAYLRALERAGWAAPVPAPPARFTRLRCDGGPDDLLGPHAQPGEHGLPAWWKDLPLGLAGHLPPAGEVAAHAALGRFVEHNLGTYAQRRDNPGADATSRLSAYLHFGSLHPRTVLEVVGTGSGADRLRTELAWRDFYADVLWHHPRSAREPLQAFGRHLRWDSGAAARRRFEAWATGTTGYELVDAAMRQLLQEGWVHNRARMVAASFLVKDLHLDWRLGARWFMWHLVDGDLASNQHGWQWVAGTGTDAAPFHRVFNPELQRERFDADRTYVRRYARAAAVDPAGGAGPEAADPGAPRRHAAVIDHASERREALARLAEARQSAAMGAELGGPRGVGRPGPGHREKS